MALTMTRYRTQTTLTKLAERTAEVHGELAYVEKLLAEMPEHQDFLEARRTELERDRDALYATLCQFDPALNPTDITESDAWRKRVLPGIRRTSLPRAYLAKALK